MPESPLSPPDGRSLSRNEPGRGTVQLFTIHAHQRTQLTTVAKTVTQNSICYIHFQHVFPLPLPAPTLTGQASYLEFEWDTFWSTWLSFFRTPRPAAWPLALGLTLQVLDLCRVLVCTICTNPRCFDFWSRAFTCYSPPGISEYWVPGTFGVPGTGYCSRRWSDYNF